MQNAFLCPVAFAFASFLHDGASLSPLALFPLLNIRVTNLEYIMLPDCFLLQRNMLYY
jgi:hypothetical protein